MPEATPVNEYGEDIRVEIDDGTGTFIVVSGETGYDFKRSSSDIDDSDKDGGAYGSGSYGQQKLTISLTGNVKLPDPGFSRAFAVSKMRPPHTGVKIMKGAIVKYSGICAIGPISTTGKNNATVDYSFDAMNRGAPLVDALDAVAVV